MTEKKHYDAPEMMVCQLETEGIISTSGDQPQTDPKNESLKEKDYIWG